MHHLSVVAVAQVFYTTTMQGLTYSWLHAKDAQRNPSRRPQSRGRRVSRSKPARLSETATLLRPPPYSGAREWTPVGLAAPPAAAKRARFSASPPRRSPPPLRCA